MSQVPPIHLLPESGILPERTHKPVKCFPTFIWKYDIDAHSPWWKKLFFHLVFMPVVRFGYDRMGLLLPEAKIPSTANLPHGAFLTKEWMSVYVNRWQAEEFVSRRSFAGYTEVAFEWEETVATTEPRSVCPTSRVDRRRRDSRDWEIHSALAKLQDTLVRTRPQMESFKSLRT